MICENCSKSRVCKYREECEQLEKEHVENKLTVKPYSLIITCSEKVNYNTGGVSSRGWMDGHTTLTPCQPTVTLTATVEEEKSEFEKNCEGYAHWAKINARTPKTNL